MEPSEDMMLGLGFDGLLKVFGIYQDAILFVFQAMAKWCKQNQISLVAVGSEEPLGLGLGDVLQKAGIACFGPGRQGAQIEADKKWSKDFMLRHGIPTARYESFTEVARAQKFIRR